MKFAGGQKSAFVRLLITLRVTRISFDKQYAEVSLRRCFAFLSCCSDIIMESVGSDTYQDNVSFVHNGTNETVRYHVLSTVQAPAFTIILTTLLAVTGLVGLVGNVLVIRFARSRKRRQQQPTRFAPRHFFLFVESLALSDILTCAIAIPSMWAAIFCRHTKRTDWFCKGIGFLVQLFPVITIYNLLVVSLERYLAIRRPMYCLSKATAKRLVKFAWAVGTGLTLISTAMVEAVKIDVNDRQFTFRCKAETGNTTSRTLLAIYTVCFYHLPIAFLIFTSASIIGVIRRRPAVGNLVRRATARQKATKLLVTIVVAFVISYTPFQVILAYKVLANTDLALPPEYYLRAAFGVLVYANSAVNVFIHLMFLPGFYQSYKRIRQSGAVADTPV